MDQIRKPPHYLCVLLIYSLALALVSLIVIGLGLRDSLLYLLTVPIVLSVFFYGRRVYLTMSILLIIVAVWVTSLVSCNFQASLTNIASSALSIFVVTEAIHRLVAARQLAEERLRQSTIELEIRNAELDAFAQTVAHDLQNPLGVIVGFVEVLEEDYATLPIAELQNYLQTVAQTGRKMSNIINELLLLSSVRGMGTIERQPLDMQNIVTEALQRLAGVIEENQAEISLPESWPEAWGYAPWIEEVWVNYVSNALKYGGQPPHMELGAETRPLTALSHEVRFWVRDNGAGLTPDEQERLFIPFTRLKQVQCVEGHGLGLSIVQRIISKSGGQVGVESEKGAGSTFYFTLPGIEGNRVT